MKVSFNANQRGEVFVPYWHKLICAGRAAEGLREAWRIQFKEVQREIGFEYIRFHGVLHEDMMIYRKDKNGNPIYNWQYVDELFDFLLENKIRPIVELGFMPYDLASGEKCQFWWKGNITPPKDYTKWTNLMKELVKHFANRYGISEVLQWYFEVWNEPNDNFWSSSLEEYCKMYECTVNAIKSINNKIKVGGPAAPGHDTDGYSDIVDNFITYCDKNNVTVDFISTHPYPNSWPLDTDGNCLTAYRDENSLSTDLNWLKNRLDNSPYKNAEIHLTEWNSSPSPRDLVNDTAFMTPFIIENNLKNIGLVDSLGFWTFTDIFEENAAGATIFHGGFGLINFQGLKKPSYYGYWFLSKLGNERLVCGDNYFVTRKEDKIQILMWNYCHYEETFAAGDTTTLTQYERYSIFKEKDLHFEISVDGLEGDYRVLSYSLGRENGSIFDIWLNNGAPANPTDEELEILKKNNGPKGSIKYIKDVNAFNVQFLLKPHDVVMIELQRQL